MKTCNVTLDFSGIYTLSVIGSDGAIKQQHEQKNIITTRFLNAMAARTSNSLSYAYMSTSTITPEASYSTLPSVVASTNNRTSLSAYTSGSGLEFYTNTRVSFAFGINQFLGTITAVGIGTSTAGAGLVSWLKLTDDEGNPTSLTLVAGDRLNLTYTMKMKRPNTTSTGVINLAGADYTYELRPTEIGLSRSWNIEAGSFDMDNITSGFRIYPYNNTAPITGYSSGTGNPNGSGPESVSFSPSGNQCVWTITAGINYWNYQIGCMANSLFSLNFSPPFTKNNTQILTLVFVTTFTTS